MMQSARDRTRVNTLWLWATLVASSVVAAVLFLVWARGQDRWLLVWAMWSVSAALGVAAVLFGQKNAWVIEDITNRQAVLGLGAIVAALGGLLTIPL